MDYYKMILMHMQGDNDGLSHDHVGYFVWPLGARK